MKQIWLACLFFLLSLLLAALSFATFARREEVFRNSYSFRPRAAQEASFVTNVFELRGRTSDVEVSIRTDVDNNWAYFNLALIDDQTGQAFDFGREVGYYYGRDSDGAWSEGARTDRALIPSVPSGRYYLRVEPEMDPAAAGITYEITVRRDVPAMGFFWIAALLIAIPPVFVTFRSLGFEQARWRESDYPSSSTAKSEGDD